MNDNEIKDSMDESGASEASARAEKIRAIRNAIRNSEASETIPEPAGQPESVAASGLAEDMKRVRESRAPMEAPRAQADAVSEIPAKNGKKSGKKKKKKKKKTLGQKFRGLFPEKGDNALEVVRKFVFLLSLVAIVVCGYMVGDYYLALWKSSRLNDSITDIYGDTYKPIYTTVEDKDEKAPYDKFYTILDGAKKLYDINPDVIGFMTIPTIDGDPIVDLPVVQAEDNNKYLDRNFKGEESIAGTLFLDWRNKFDKVEDHHLVEENSENLVVYGHNMLDESMFGSLRKYDWEEEFYGKHPIIQFNSNYELYTYKIFSVFLLDANDESDTKFDCWNQLNFNDEEEFYNFVNEAKRRTMRINDVDVKYGDPLLTLSTCNKTLGDRGRLIVLARRVRIGEDPYEGTQNSTRNKNIKWPSMYYDTKPNEKYNDKAIFIPYGPAEAVKEAEEKAAAQEKKKKKETDNAAKDASDKKEEATKNKS